MNPKFNWDAVFPNQNVNTGNFNTDSVKDVEGYKFPTIDDVVKEKIETNRHMVHKKSIDVGNVILILMGIICLTQIL